HRRASSERLSFANQRHPGSVRTPSLRPRRPKLFQTSVPSKRNRLPDRDPTPLLPQNQPKQPSRSLGRSERQRSCRSLHRQGFERVLERREVQCPGTEPDEPKPGSAAVQEVET